jgi:hypothetical protein
MGLAVATVLVAIGLVVAVSVRRRPAGRLAVVGDTLVAGVVATPATVALLTRWRDRAARWRTTAALPVVLATIAASVAIRQQVNVGIGDHPAWSDPLLMGLLSVFVGAILAERHHLRPHGGTGVRDAAPRRGGGLRGPARHGGGRGPGPGSRSPGGGARRGSAGVRGAGDAARHRP